MPATRYRVRLREPYHGEQILDLEDLGVVEVIAQERSPGGVLIVAPVFAPVERFTPRPPRITSYDAELIA